MSHFSPTCYLVWAVLSTLLGSFLLYHLWSFDRFKCLKWNNGPYSGAFKRVMTYSYLTSVPLLITYSIGFAIIKYKAGFIIFPTLGVVPTPWQLWDQGMKTAIFPLTLMFSISWSLEMVTHLEELCFWLFLVNAGSAQQNWFQTLYFKTWVVGSILAVIYMPLVTIFTRADPLKCEAFTALAGSLGSLSLTLWFTPILWTFPSFLASLRKEGVDIPTVVRLTKFHELNVIRVLFRFLFVVPLLILGVDGVRPHIHINDKMIGTDILAIIAGFGCAISSGITLVIFFPRSIEGEIASKEASRLHRNGSPVSSMIDSRVYAANNVSQDPPIVMQQHQYSYSGNYLLGPDAMERHMSLPSSDGQPFSPLSQMSQKSFKVDDGDELARLPRFPAMRPNRRRGDEIELGGIDEPAYLTEGNLSKHNVRTSNLNPMVHNFTSPINIIPSAPNSRSNESRLTFTRR